MKFTKIMTISAMALLMMIGTAMAQDGTMARGGEGRPGGSHGKGKLEERIPDLTPEQSEKLKTIRIAHHEKASKMQAEAKVKQAELELLKVQDKPDLKAIDKKVDELSGLRGNMLKARIRHELDIKSVLTKEQQVVFDQMHRKRGGKKQGHKGHQGDDHRGRKM